MLAVVPNELPWPASSLQPVAEPWSRRDLLVLAMCTFTVTSERPSTVATPLTPVPLPACRSSAAHSPGSSTCRPRAVL